MLSLWIIKILVVVVDYLHNGFIKASDICTEVNKIARRLFYPVYWRQPSRVAYRHGVRWKSRREIQPWQCSDKSANKVPDKGDQSHMKQHHRYNQSQLWTSVSIIILAALGVLDR